VKEEYQQKVVRRAGGKSVNVKPGRGAVDERLGIDSEGTNKCSELKKALDRGGKINRVEGRKREAKLSRAAAGGIS